MASKSYQQRADKCTKIKTQYNRDLINLYKSTEYEVTEWLKRHTDCKFVAQEVINKVYSMKATAQDIITDWKFDTPIRVIEKEWISIQSTARRANDIVHAFFIIMESGDSNSMKLVEDLLFGKVSPSRYLENRKVPVDLAEQTKESIVLVEKKDLLEGYNKKVVEYKVVKDEISKIILAEQSTERKRHKELKDRVDKWKAKFPDYKEVGMWLDCLVEECHSNAWGVISLLSIDDGKREDDLKMLSRMVNSSEHEINKVETLIAHYDVVYREKEAKRIEEERIAKEAEKARAKEERERKEREAIERIKNKFGNKNKSDNNNQEDKPMTKAKTIKPNIQAEPVEEVEQLNLTIDAMELEGISFSRFDIHKANNICIESGRLKFSKAITELIYNKGYQKVMPLEQKGSMFLVFPRAMGEDISLAESGDDMFGYVDSETIASKVLAHTKGDKNYQEYKVQVGSPKGQDYIYAKITENINN